MSSTLPALLVGVLGLLGGVCVRIPYSLPIPYDLLIPLTSTDDVFYFVSCRVWLHISLSSLADCELLEGWEYVFESQQGRESMISCLSLADTQ